MEVVIKIILGFLLGVAIIPVAFGVFLLSLFLVGAILYGLALGILTLYVRFFK